MSFGDIMDLGNIERYNLENKFNLSENASAFSICKSLILYLDDESQSDLINAVLLPIDPILNGLPIKFFIYRGILKSSILTTENKIITDYSNWSSNNIIKIIIDIQNKINSENNETNEANSHALGIQYSNLNSDFFIEKLFFNTEDEFHPLIVGSGCEIGKFKGGITLGGIQVVLDKIGSELTLGIARKSSHIFEINKLPILPNQLSDSEFQQVFQNRLEKDVILTYLDITAFYGLCKSNSIKIGGLNNLNDDSFLNYFYNKNKTYIDLRGDWGNSYNLFFKYINTLSISYQKDNEGNNIFNDVNYYQKWPIICFDSITTNLNKLCLKTPLDSGYPQTENYILTYTLNLNTKKGKNNKDLSISDLGISDNIQFYESEKIDFQIWKYSDNKIGSNYILLKLYSGNEHNINNQNGFLNNYFSLKMKNIFDDEIQTAGQFQLYNYSSLNFPILKDTLSGDLFVTSGGIINDNVNVYLFLNKQNKINKVNKEIINFEYAFLPSGKYSFDTENTLNLFDSISKILKSSANKLKTIEHTYLNEENNTDEIINCVFFENISLDQNNPLNNIEFITFDKFEFLSLLNYQDTFDLAFLSFKNNKIIEEFNFNINYSEVTFSIPITIPPSDNTEKHFINIENWQNDVLHNDEKILLNLIYSKNN